MRKRNNKTGILATEGPAISAKYECLLHREFVTVSVVPCMSNWTLSALVRFRGKVLQYLPRIAFEVL